MCLAFLVALIAFHDCNGSADTDVMLSIKQTLVMSVTGVPRVQTYTNSLLFGVTLKVLS